MSEENQARQKESDEVVEFRGNLSGKRLELFESLTPEQRMIVAKHGLERRGRIHFDLLEEHGLVVYGKPDRTAWKKFMRAMPEDKGELDKVMIASDNLCIDCVLFPSKDQMLSIFDDAPKHSTSAAEVIAVLADGKRPK